ncbi:hypothetical protein MRO55_24795, partial [Escherichia coli]|nr:hypothetical protein [Escherichia coli]
LDRLGPWSCVSSVGSLVLLLRISHSTFRLNLDPTCTSTRPSLVAETSGKVAAGYGGAMAS